MEKITLHDKTFKTYLDYNQVEEIIDGVAQKINADFKDKNEIPVLLCILNGAIMFTAELMKKLDFNLELLSMKLSSYEGTNSTGHIAVSAPLSKSVKDKTVIICEDIVDTGNTIVFLKKYLMEQGAKDVKVCTMLFKPESYSKDVTIDYYGKSIPNDFIVGFGLDYDELGRNYKDIYVID